MTTPSTGPDALVRACIEPGNDSVLNRTNTAMSSSATAGAEARASGRMSHRLAGRHSRTNSLADSSTRATNRATSPIGLQGVQGSGGPATWTCAGPRAVCADLRLIHRGIAAGELQPDPRRGVHGRPERALPVGRVTRHLPDEGRLGAGDDEVGAPALTFQVRGDASGMRRVLWRENGDEVHAHDVAERPGHLRRRLGPGRLSPDDRGAAMSMRVDVVHGRELITRSPLECLIAVPGDQERFSQEDRYHTG